MTSTPCSDDRRRRRLVGARRVFRLGFVVLAGFVAGCESLDVSGRYGHRSGLQDVEVSVPF
ncbi:hypothetical protein [Roseospira navarrensis]|uniref:Uncharacterized protein n=1 Tax=Roseospira navarrensis TaxID=140058 RepID=A0A7X1ZH90_9PROT|nr:hypothetical protein [Roseospira navarrensis]MQX37984.1 hypothetical protein [Roseospira navarrensis]